MGSGVTKKPRQLWFKLSELVRWGSFGFWGCVWGGGLFKLFAPPRRSESLCVGVTLSPRQGGQRLPRQLSPDGYRDKGDR